MGENGTPEVSCLTGNHSRSQCVNQTKQKAVGAMEKQYSASQARSAPPGAGLSALTISDAILVCPDLSPESWTAVLR